MKDKTISIAIVDDHALFRAGLRNLIQSLGDEFEVVLEAGDGKEFLDKLANTTPPDIAILDMSMPVMDGYQTTLALQKDHKDLRVLVLTMVEDEKTMLKMLQTGIKGYLSKDVEPGELKLALTSIMNKGFYYTDYVTGKLIDAVQQPAGSQKEIKLSDREQEFLKHACSEYTYKEIADIMFLSIKTIDGYRNSLFEKLEVKSRTGMALYAIKNGLVTL